MRKSNRWLLPFLWAALMFTASADPHSGEHSLAVLQWAFGPGFAPEQVSAAQLVLRKLAHLSEYAVLLTLVSFAWGPSRFQSGTRWLLWAAVAGFALTDELHQTFVAGRGGCFQDVIIDSCGAGLAAILLVRTRWRRLALRWSDRSLARASRKGLK